MYGNKVPTLKIRIDQLETTGCLTGSQNTYMQPRTLKLCSCYYYYYYEFYLGHNVV